MMWRKAVLFGDSETAERILTADHPREAKTLGRQVADFDQKSWESVCFDIVVTGNLAKFSQNAQLRDYLSSTGDQTLAEASPVDRVWGIGLAIDDERVRNPSQWRGLNLLGFAVMEVRTMLMNSK